MKWVAYYLIFVVNIVTCWPSVKHSSMPWRAIWSLLAPGVVSFPFWLPAPVAFYYGLLLNATVSFWSADTYMGKGIRRLRAVVGGVLLLPAPLIFQHIQTSWMASLLVPTLGHLVVSGASWPIVISLIKSLAESSPQGLKQISNSAVEDLLPRVATRLLFAAVVYTGYLAVVYQGRFWFGPPLAVLTFVLLLIGRGLRERGKAPTLGAASKILLVFVGTLFTSASILALSALTGWVAFKAGFYDLFLGLANLDEWGIVRAVFAIVFGAYLCSNMLLLYKLDRVADEVARD